ncbi:reverse transcriptase domain-containing protein [Tanacetum coccineum]
MLADSLLPTTFWAKAVSTACYVQNKVLVTKPYNKTPYKLLHGRPPSISFMRPFGCPMTILNTLDPLGKFDEKADEGSGPHWLFDIDLLTNSMNYEPVTARNQSNNNAGIKYNVDTVPTQQYILLPLLYESLQSSKDVVADDASKKTNEELANEGERNGQEKEGEASNKEGDQNVQYFRAELDNLLVQQKEGYANNTNRVSTISPSVSVVGESFTNVDDLPTDPLMPDLEDTADLLNTGIFSGEYDNEDEGTKADLNNLEITLNVSPIPITRIHKDHCMRTRSQSRNSNRQQQQVPQTFVEPFDLEEPIDNPAPPVVTMADNRTMAQLLEAPTEGYEDAIVVPEITADNFELKHGLLTLVQNKQFFGHDKEDPHAHIRYFNKITSTMKFPNVPSTSVKLMLFPFSLEGAARIWLEKEPPRSILTWDDLVSKFINKFFPPSKTTNLQNEITRFQQRFDETFYEAWDRFNDLLRACPHHGFSKLHQLDTFYNALNSNDQDSLNSAAGGNFLDKMPRDCLRIIESKSKVCNSRNKPVVAKVSMSNSTPGISPDVAELKDMVKALLLDKKNQSQAPATVKAVEESCVTCGGAHSHRNCPATDGNVYRDNIQEYVSQAAVANFNQGNTSYRPPIANQIRPPVPPPPSSLPKVVECETEVTKNTVPPTNNGSTKDVQPLVVQVETHVPNSEPVVAPFSALKPNLKLSIPYPSRLNDQKIHEKFNNQIEKFYQIFQDLYFDISFADALILIRKFASTLKSLISNKEKLFELARTPLNEHCSAVLLKKLPKKLGDPDKFLIPCDFPRMDECLALADLGASINLMPLSMWKKLSLPELTPTCMNLELTDFVDFDADPRVPLILGRSFLKTGRALIDVYEGELTFHVGKEAVTFNLDQTSRYSSNYDDNSVNQIDVIDMACEEYSQEVLSFFDGIASGNPTPYYDPIISTSSPTLTPFGDSDFLLEEVDAFLALEDDPTSLEVDHSYYDSKGDILLLEAFFNDDP